MSSSLDSACPLSRTCCVLGSLLCPGCTAERETKTLGPGPCSGRGWPTVLQEGWCRCFRISGAEPGVERAHTWGRPRARVASFTANPSIRRHVLLMTRTEALASATGFNLCKMAGGQRHHGKGTSSVLEGDRCPTSHGPALGVRNDASFCLAVLGRACSVQARGAASSGPDAASPFI